MRLFYSFLFYLFIPVILLRLLWRGVRAPAYWQRWAERFGFGPILASQSNLWIHAVSMGEVQAAVPLIQTLQTRFPQQTILLTTMTPTGSQRVRELFGDNVQHVYLPYDLPDAMARFLARIQPKWLILMETELWPNLLQACQQRAIPVILANARLSARSAAGYQRVAGLTQQMLTSLTAIAAQTEVDANRFIQLGMPSHKIFVTGSLKFESRLPPDFSETAKTLRQQWGQKRAVWIAASTHEGEEDAVLNALTTLKPKWPDLLLVLVPRHPERFNRVVTLCQQRGFRVARRSQGEVNPQTEIYVGDTMGELSLLYAACDIAFVGGSLVPIGCHNLLEPAAVALPVIMGPEVFECAEICRQLLEVQAAQQIQEASQLANAVQTYLSDPMLKNQTGANGRLFVEQNRGTLKRLLTVLDNVLR